VSWYDARHFPRRHRCEREVGALRRRANPVTIRGSPIRARVPRVVVVPFGNRVVRGHPRVVPDAQRQRTQPAIAGRRRTSLALARAVSHRDRVRAFPIHAINRASFGRRVRGQGLHESQRSAILARRFGYQRHGTSVSGNGRGRERCVGEQRSCVGDESKRTANLPWRFIPRVERVEASPGPVFGVPDTRFQASACSLRELALWIGRVNDPR
jgi:hypothetical protein